MTTTTRRPAVTPTPIRPTEPTTCPFCAGPVPAHLWAVAMYPGTALCRPCTLDHDLAEPVDVLEVAHTVAGWLPDAAARVVIRAGHTWATLTLHAWAEARPWWSGSDVR